MELVADILLIGGALAATAYCIVLSRRLRRFTDLEKGVGGAIAMLSVQVDDMTRTLEVAQASARESAQSLGDLTGKAEAAARRLELLVAAMHDLPAPDEQATGENGERPAGKEAAEEAAEEEQPESALSASSGTQARPAPAAPEGQDIGADDAEPSAPLFLSQRVRTGAAAE